MPVLISPGRRRCLDTGGPALPDIADRVSNHHGIRRIVIEIFKDAPDFLGFAGLGYVTRKGGEFGGPAGGGE